MTDHAAHPADEAIDAHGSAGHDADGHAGADHGTEPLGPIDVAAWATGIIGVVLGLVVVVALGLSTGAIA